jgi:hypothetical protein
VKIEEQWPWVTSSYTSGGEGNCVEVAILPDRVAVRDTKNRKAGYFLLSPAAWSGLLDTLR